MKYLIIRKNQTSILTDLNADRLEDLMEIVEEAKRMGTVDGIYGIVGGGLVAIVSADDHAALVRGLRKFGIYDAEIHPIRDATDLIREHLESKRHVSPS